MLELRHIGYTTFSGRPLLQGISARLSPQRLTAIMGLNGAGKTTLLKVVSRYLAPSHGEVLWNSSSLSLLSVKALARQLAYVPQDFPTDFPFTVDDFVLMGRFAWQERFFASREDHDIVTQCLERMSLRALRHRLIGTLSGGEKQRVLMARALAQNTPVILLDEPLNHLDIKHRLFALELLREECRQHGKTILAVMHDFHDVQDYFDEVWFLKDGCLEFSGPVREAFDAARLRDVFDVDVITRLHA